MSKVGARQGNNAWPLLLLALTVVLTVALAGSAAGDDPQPHAADVSALTEALRQPAVETSPPRPGLAQYLSDLSLAFATWVNELVARWLPDFDAWSSQWLGLVARVLIAIVAALAVLLTVRAVYARLRQRAGGHGPAASPLRAAPRQSERQTSPSFWEAALGERLAAGDIAAALEALWWWLACVLVPTGVEPSSTTRELVLRAGRCDLLPSIRRLDRMLYGSLRPGMSDVERLWHELRQSVGEGASGEA